MARSWVRTAGWSRNPEAVILRSRGRDSFSISGSRFMSCRSRSAGPSLHSDHPRVDVLSAGRLPAMDGEDVPSGPESRPGGIGEGDDLVARREAPLLRREDAVQVDRGILV